MGAKVRLGLTTNSVVPSGVARAATMPPMVPPAPPRLSTTTGWPTSSPTCAATGRAKMSFEPPGGNGTIHSMARDGRQSAAWSGPATVSSRPPSAVRRETFIGYSMSTGAGRLAPGSACRHRPGRFRALPQNGNHDGAGDTQTGKGNGDGAEDRAQQGAEHALLDRQHSLGIAAAARQVRRQPVAAGLVECESVDRAAAAIADRVAGGDLGLDQLDLGARRVGREAEAETVDVVRRIIAAVHRALLLVIDHVGAGLVEHE